MPKSRPPSRAVIEAVEQAMLGHVLCDCLPDSATRAEMRDHVHGEVARAAETAALKVAADECEANARDWYGTHIFRDVNSADLAAVRSAMQAKGKDIDNLSAWRFREALTTRAGILRRTADELTDRDRRAVMPTYIIKPSRDEDFYVWWSTVVDAPIGWGPRDYVPLDNEGSPERFARADERGTSANWPDWPVEKMPFGWNVSEWRITNQDDLEETGEGWWLLPRKNLREFCRRRDAGEQIADLVKWEPYGHVSRRLLAGTRPGPLA